jgi:uncharacterized membrane protein YkoI
MHFQPALAILLAALFFGTAPVQARENFAAPSDRARHETRAGVSLDQAVRQVRAQTGGRVLSAETINRGGRAMHRIKVLLPSGHVQIVHVDAERG